MFNCIRPFKFHKWGPWTIVGAGDVRSRGTPIFPANEWYTSATFVAQARTYKDCGFVQHKNSKS
jgi:hypothetical protein